MDYSIKEISERLRIPASTLRYYEKRGLIGPLRRSAGQVRVTKELTTIVDGGGTFVDFDKQSFIDAMAPLAAQLESEGYWATPGLYDSVQALPH